jgi:hypothetical protein
MCQELAKETAKPGLHFTCRDLSRERQCGGGRQMTASTGKTHWQRYRGLYIAVAIAILPVLYFFPSEPTTVSRPLLAVAVPAPGSSLVATLESNTLDAAREDSISFTADAAPGTRIENMTVCVSAPEFTLDPTSGCTSVKIRSKSDTAAPTAAAVIHLVPKGSSGRYTLLLNASWIRYAPRPQPAAPQPGTASAAGVSQVPATSCDAPSAGCIPLAESRAMTLGPVDLGVDRLTRFAGRLSRFLKDLTLPIILIVLANWLTSVSAERDRKREASEAALREERERKQGEEQERERKLEREQEEEKQIAHILLPKVMRLAGHFYLPLTLNCIGFVKPSRSNPRELSFSLFSFFLVARSLKEKEGGVFFKDMAAEQIFAIANNLIRDLVVGVVGDEDRFTECLNYLDSWVPQGQRRWPRLAERTGEAPASWVRLEDWLAGLEKPKFEAMRFVFNSLAGVIRYESNAPFSYWYSNSSAENLFKLAQEIPAPASEVFGELAAADLQDFQNLLAAYREGKE